MGVKFFYRDIDLVYFVNNKLISNKLINQKDRVLLSFSGGQDSICFVFILNQLYCQLELDITFFWCHHLWQTDSFYLMQQIAKLSFLLQFNSCFPIPLTCISSELLARKWRQNCSYRVSLFYNYSKICLAHTFNDKVENIFLNFIRGTGLIGLAPLRWIQLVKCISKLNITNKNINNYAYPKDHLEDYPEGVNAFAKVKSSVIVRIIPQQNYLTSRYSLSSSTKICTPSGNKSQICYAWNSLRSVSTRLRNRRFVSKSAILHFSNNSTISYARPARGTMCIASMQGNSHKLKNLTKKVVIKLMQKGCDASLYPEKFILVKQRSLNDSPTLHLKNLTSSPLKCTPFLLKRNGILAPLKPALYPSACSKDYPAYPEGFNATLVQLRYQALRFVQAGGYLKCKISDLYKLNFGVSKVHFSRENSKTLLYKLLCVAKEPGFSHAALLNPKVHFNYPSRFDATLGYQKPLNKTWGKQLLDGCYIVRPLLSISRIELNKICSFWELPIYPDQSNQKVKFLRNRVRGQLLPTIKLFFNSNIENIFVQLAKLVETEDYCVTQIVNEFTKNTNVYHTKLGIYSKRKKQL